MSKKLMLPKDIQQARWDEKWAVLKDMFDAWALKCGSPIGEIGIFKCLIYGESNLELCLASDKKQSNEETDMMNDKMFKIAVDELAKGLQLFEDQLKDKHVPLCMELHLLISKCYFIANDFEKSIRFVDQSHVTQESVDELSKRGRILAAEAFCNKGKALEMLKTDSGCDDDIIAAYRFSADICLWLFSEEYKTGSLRKATELVSSKSVPKNLFHSFRKPVELEVQRGNIQEAVELYRSFLRVVETRGTAALRKVLALQIAEILLASFCEKSYNSPPIQIWQNENRPKSGALVFNTYQQRSLSTSSSGRSTPKVSQKDFGRSRSSSKDGSFCPKDSFEEALLVLLIGESLVLRDGCVSLFDKDDRKRQETIFETNAVYDLLCIAIARRKQYGFFLECLERGIKLAYHQFDLWFQYGLALICDRRIAHFYFTDGGLLTAVSIISLSFSPLVKSFLFKKALVVLKRCHGMQPDNNQVLLYCIKICINNLQQYEEAIALAKEAVITCIDPLTKSNFFLAMGIGYSVLACKAPSHSEEKSLRAKSKEALEKALDLDPNEVDVICQLALNHAISRELTVAANFANQALQLDPFHRDSLLLLSLILSAQSRYQEALEVIEVILREFPEDFQSALGTIKMFYFGNKFWQETLWHAKMTSISEESLLQVKVCLSEECFGEEKALSVCQEMLRLWNDLYGEEIGEGCVTQQEREGKSAKSSLFKKSALDVRSPDGSKSVKSLTFADAVRRLQDDDDDDEVSSITASVTLERSLSEIASTAVSGAKLKGAAAVAILAKIWLTTANVFLNMGDIEEASNCLLEASSIFPVSPEVLCMRGRLNYMQKNHGEAKACFDSALAVTPKSVEAMEKLALLHQESGSTVMAQKYIQDAIAVDPLKPSLWHVLGVIMATREEHEEAANCFLASLDLEATYPILPFATVPRHLKSGDL